LTASCSVTIGVGKAVLLTVMSCHTSTSSAAPTSGATIFMAVAETWARTRAWSWRRRRRGRRDGEEAALACGAHRNAAVATGSALSGLSMAFMASPSIRL
jgi:hypothetical protein